MHGQQNVEFSKVLMSAGRWTKIIQGHLKWNCKNIKLFEYSSLVGGYAVLTCKQWPTFRRRVASEPLSAPLYENKSHVKYLVSRTVQSEQVLNTYQHYMNNVSLKETELLMDQEKLRQSRYRTEI